MTESIAVVGMSCRFPGAPDIEAFWKNLVDGRESIARGFDAEAQRAEGLAPVGAYGFLDGVDLFDHRLFNITPREAAFLDPQHRIWLELVWEALEGANLGDRPDLLTGVFAGGGPSAYLESNLKRDGALAERLRRSSSGETRRILNGNDREFLPLRTSHAFDFKGPSVNVQTACSTALVAVTTACRALLSREADAAVAGAISILRLSDEPFFAESDAIHSLSGRCRPFDAEADGTVFGDGGGVVILRRMADALSDGDRIYAVIRGWGVTNDGAGKASFTAPNAEAQALAIRKAWDAAGLPVDSVSYVEAHGAGTRIGDPIEFDGLRRALGDRGRPCAIGAVKSSIGHLDSAAGVAGLIKTCLMLHHRTCVPTLGFGAPNLMLGMDRTRFSVTTETGAWRTDGGVLRAGVTALGVGGTNCHLALEEAPAHAAAAAERAGPHLLIVSGQSPAALDRLCTLHADNLAQSKAHGDYCRAAAIGRRHLKYRAAVVAERPALAEAIRARAGARTKRRPGKRRVLFAFGGQLSSHAGMTEALFRSEPVFKRWLLTCEEVVTPLLGRRLTDLLFDSGDALKSTRFEQPALCAVQVALAETWKAWGVEPHAVLGYSLGEFAAAHAAGAVSLEDVLRLVATRGRLMDSLPGPGGMATVFAPPSTVSAALRAEAVEIAGLQGEDRCVISGAKPGIDHVVRRLRDAGVTVSILTDCYAFHAPWIEPCLPELADAAGSAVWRTPSTTFVSTATGKIEREAVADPGYWVAQARRPVRFAEALAAAEDAGCDLALEMGPSEGLARLAAAAGATTLWVSSLKRSVAEPAAIKRALGDLYEAGVEIDWRSCLGEGGPFVPLPRYPFDRESFWKGPPPRNRADSTIAIKTVWSAHAASHLRDHRLFGHVVVPASQQIAWVIDAVEARWNLECFTIEDWVFVRPVLIPDNGEIEIALTLVPDAAAQNCYVMEASLPGSSEGGADVFLWARLSLDASDAAPTDDKFDSAALEAEFADSRSGGDFYATTWVQGGDTGPGFRRIDRIWARDGEAVARISARTPSENEAVFGPVIEAGFQSLYATYTIETVSDLKDARRAFVPYAIERADYRRPDAPSWGWCRSRIDAGRRTGDSIFGAINLYTAEGRGVLAVSGFQLRPLKEAAIESAGNACRASVFTSMASPAGAMAMLAEITGAPLSALPDATFLVEAGLDSLMAVRLRNFLRTRREVDISLGDLLGTTTLGALRRMDEAPRRPGEAGEPGSFA